MKSSNACDICITNAVSCRAQNMVHVHFPGSRQQEACGLLEDEAVRRAYKGTLRPQAIGGGKVMMVTEFSDQLLMFLLKCRNPKVFGDRRENTVHLDGELSVVDVLRSRRQQRLAREAAEEAAQRQRQSRWIRNLLN